MSHLKFSIADGKILMDGKTIAPLDFIDFKIIANRIGINFYESSPMKRWKNIGLDVEFSSNKFGMTMSYEEGKLYSCWFGWDGGISKLKGYETTERELIADKNLLTKIMVKNLNKSPDVKNYNHDIFQFDWGQISTSASIQSTSVAIGIAWFSLNRSSLVTVRHADAG